MRGSVAVTQDANVRKRVLLNVVRRKSQMKPSFECFDVQQSVRAASSVAVCGGYEAAALRQRRQASVRWQQKSDARAINGNNAGRMTSRPPSWQMLL